MPLASGDSYGQWRLAPARDGRRVATRKPPPGVKVEIQDDFDPPFEAVEPAECRGPVLFNSPHSGRVYPRAFLRASRLDIAALRRSEDSFVDDLIVGIAARGPPSMKAHFPRC